MTVRENMKLMKTLGEAYEAVFLPMFNYVTKNRGNNWPETLRYTIGLRLK